MEKEKLIEYMRKAVACHREIGTACLGRDCCDCPHDYPVEAIELIESALKLLEISALEKQEQDRWISVTERLPEKEGCYLVTVKNDHRRRYSKTAWYSGDGWFARQDIIAWRLTPEPYKEEDNE